MDGMGKEKTIDGCLGRVLGSSHSFIFGLVGLSEFADRNYMTHPGTRNLERKKR